MSQSAAARRDDAPSDVSSTATAPRGGIECRGVEKTYHVGNIETPVLRGLDLDIAPGEFVLLLGPSGCGKTTFLNLLGALDRPDGGILKVGGTDLARLTDAQRVNYRAAEVGFIFQFYNLLPTLSAAENVELGLEPLGISRAERIERAASLLERVGLGKKLTNFPAQLSGGEQQRVAIARALARRPKVMLADEPTGNLDEETGEKVFALMRELQQELACTTVVVTHNPALTRMADRAVHIRDGKVEP